MSSKIAALWGSLVSGKGDMFMGVIILRGGGAHNIYCIAYSILLGHFEKCNSNRTQENLYCWLNPVYKLQK